MRSDFPSIDYQVDAISPWSRESMAGVAVLSGTISPTSRAWPIANTALFFPFRLREQIKITQAVVGVGSTAGNNFDVGIYDRYGNRLVSGGSTARVVDSENVVNITDIVLGRGLYYMALVSDSTSAFTAIAPTSTALCKLGGMKEMATAFPLPSTATFATVTSAFIPVMALYRNSI